MSKAREKYGSWRSMLDMSFILMLLFMGMFVVAVMQMRTPTEPTKGPERKAEYMIEMDWPATNFDDLDLHVLKPDRKIVYFNARDMDGVLLDRDDLGYLNDLYHTENGEQKIVPINNEVVTIRGILPGRYVVNVQVFASRMAWGKVPSTPTFPYPVKFRLMKINPRVTTLVTKEVIVEKVGQQVTAFSFTINDDGTVSAIDTEDQVPFIAIGGTARGGM